jgi:ABC-type multidrug transport system ATPase subunit
MGNKPSYGPVPTVELHSAGSSTADSKRAGIQITVATDEKKHRVPEVHLICDQLYLALKTEEQYLLQDVSFDAKAGEVTAIMGPSGSGKTTLLECLMGKLPTELPNHTAGGVIWFQGGTGAEYKNCRFAFVEQQVSLLPGLTVGETLQFSADLQLQDMDRAARTAWVAELLDVLGLTQCRDVRVGSAMSQTGAVFANKGISGGQRKRLAIGKEMIALPSVLLLDEPTTGLDSESALEVLQVLKEMATRLRSTVILTINQPSRDCFNELDQVVLLSGCSSAELRGRVVLTGPRSQLGLILDQYQDDKTAKQRGTVDGECLIKLSRNDGLVSRRAAAPDNHLSASNINQAKARALSWRPTPQTHICRQFTTLFLRDTLQQKRDPAIFWTRLFMYTMLCLFVGSLYSFLQPTEEHLRDRISFHNFMASFLISLTVSCAPAFVEQKQVYEQETNNGHYEPLAYVMVQGLVRVPCLIVLVSVCTITQFLLIDLYQNEEQMLIYALNLFCALYCAESIVMLISAVTWGGVIPAVTVSIGFLALALPLCGFYLLPSHMNRVYQFLHRAAFQTYYFRLLVWNDLDGRRFLSSICQGAAARFPTVNGTVIWPATCFINGTSVLESFEIHDVSVSQSLLMMLLMALMWQCLLAIVLYVKQHYGNAAKTS